MEEDLRLEIFSLIKHERKNEILKSAESGRSLTFQQCRFKDKRDLRWISIPSILDDRDLKRFLVHGLNGIHCVHKCGVT